MSSATITTLMVTKAFSLFYRATLRSNLGHPSKIGVKIGALNTFVNRTTEKLYL
jgi:hypothetical protein